MVSGHGGNSFKSATNRFYYAAFYVSRALLALRRWIHRNIGGVIALFNKSSTTASLGIRNIDFFEIKPDPPLFSSGISDS